MESLTQWVVVWVMMLGLSLFWLCYLIRLVLQDEAAMEIRRRKLRNRELRRRAVEDEETAKRNRQLQRQRAAARANANRTGSPPPPKPAATPDNTAKA